jgi:hypothetical protein
MIERLNDEHFLSMRAVRNGADVFSFAIARRLREVQSRHPHWLQIGKRQMQRPNESGAGQLAYFGAILTDAGRVALRMRLGSISGRAS